MQYFLFIVIKYRFTHNFTQIIIFNLGRIVYDGMDRIVYVKGDESSYGHTSIHTDLKPNMIGSNRPASLQMTTIQFTIPFRLSL